jgi:peptidylglycine monooxygenase
MKPYSNDSLGYLILFDVMQMFYPVENKQMIIRQRDWMAARCTMNNNLTHPVMTGPTGDDEMCNFYMMYYVDGQQILNKKYCFSAGPPFYYWTSEFSVPTEVDQDASRI